MTEAESERDKRNQETAMLWAGCIAMVAGVLLIGWILGAL